jgi:hypothetical protein
MNLIFKLVDISEILFDGHESTYKFQDFMSDPSILKILDAETIKEINLSSLELTLKSGQISCYSQNKKELTFDQYVGIAEIDSNSQIQIFFEGVNQYNFPDKRINRHCKVPTVSNQKIFVAFPPLNSERCIIPRDRYLNIQPLIQYEADKIKYFKLSTIISGISPNPYEIGYVGDFVLNGYILDLSIDSPIIYLLAQYWVQLIFQKMIF